MQPSTLQATSHTPNVTSSQREALAKDQPDGETHFHQRQTQVPAATAPRVAAEIIVNEEREAKSKMPSHKGLEDYKLLEKMGESVLSLPSIH